MKDLLKTIIHDQDADGFRIKWLFQNSGTKLSVSCHKFLQIITYQDVSFSKDLEIPVGLVYMKIVIDGYAAIAFQFNRLIRHCKDLSTDPFFFHSDLFQLSLFHMQVSHTGSQFFILLFCLGCQFTFCCKSSYIFADVNRKLIFFYIRDPYILINRLLAYDLGHTCHFLASGPETDLAVKICVQSQSLKAIGTFCCISSLAFGLFHIRRCAKQNSGNFFHISIFVRLFYNGLIKLPPVIS